MKFRKLLAEEIQPKIVRANGGGIEIMLFKKPLTDLALLEENFHDNFDITYREIAGSVLCSISIYEDDKVITREGLGEGQSMKAASTDAMHRAGVAIGIGRELYTIDNLFIPKEKLSSHKLLDNGNWSCYDDLSVSLIEYNEDDKISHVQIAISNYGKVHSYIDFYNNKNSNLSSQKEASLPENNVLPQNAGNAEAKDVVLKEDEKLLFGMLRGKTYREVKNTPEFSSFVKWAKSTNKTYDNPAVMQQMEKIKNLSMDN